MTVWVVAGVAVVTTTCATLRIGGGGFSVAGAAVSLEPTWWGLCVCGVVAVFLNTTCTAFATYESVGVSWVTWSACSHALHSMVRRSSCFPLCEAFCVAVLACLFFGCTGTVHGKYLFFFVCVCVGIPGVICCGLCLLRRYFLLL